MQIDQSDKWRLLRGLRTRVGRWLIGTPDTDGIEAVDALARAEELRVGQARILESIASDEDLAAVLCDVCQLLENQLEETFAAVLLLNDGRVERGAGPSLPADCLTWEADLLQGSNLQTAEQTRKPGRHAILVADLQTDPRTAASSAQAMRHGFHSCWLEPMFGSDGSVFGALTLYQHKTGLPSEDQLRLLSEVAHMASVAVERRRMTDRARRDREQLETLVRTLPGAVFRISCGDEWTTLFVSDEILRISGHEASAFVGKPTSVWSSLTHPDDEARLATAVKAALMNRQSYSIEYRIRHKSGVVRWVFERGQIVFEEDQPRFLDGVQFDVTERMMAQQALADSEWRGRTLIEGTDLILWEYDPSTLKFTYVSPQAARLGYPLEQWYTADFWVDHLHPEDRNAMVAICNQGVQRGQDHRMQYRMVAKDGREVWFDDLVQVVIDEEGKTVLMRGVLIDITAAKRMEAALELARDAAEDASRSKSLFLANMSHEIRTPLTAILGYAELLRDDADIGQDSVKRAEVAATICNAGRHLLTVLNDILDLSKIEAGKLVLELLPTQLRELVQAIRELVLPRAAARGIEFLLEVDDDVPDVVRTDPTRLRQILLNLIGNAVKFTESGHVLLRVTMAQSGEGSMLLVFEVEDTGIGMDPEQAQILFRPFTQVDSSVTRTHGGTGLGLTIARRLARLLSGDVMLLRTERTQGAVFRVTLPLDVAKLPGTTGAEADARAAEGAGQSAVDLPSLHGRILFAEDGPENQRLISYLLRRAGADVDVVGNGREALAAVAHAAVAGRPYDLLLTDVQMPEMDGLTLTRRLRQQGNGIPVVALTAHAMPEDRQRCLDSGVDDYAAKPIDRIALIHTCARWLRIATGQNL